MPVSPLLSTDPVTIGPYSLLGRVAAGGMGVVYLGRENDRPDSLVVVKTARRDVGVPADLIERLRLEARTASAVAQAAHPEGLARFVGADADASTPWVATEFVPGPSLHEAAGAAVLTVEDVTALARTLAATISDLHDAGYAHRDVKPANVVLGPAGARLVDLGLTRPVGEPDDALVLGSPGWSPPEQRQQGCDPRPGDVHGWGMCVAYAASGRSPFGGGPPEVVTRRMRTVHPDLVGLPDGLRDLVAAALLPDPLTRPVAGDIVALLASPPVTHVDLASASRAGAQTRGTARPSLETHTAELPAPTLVEPLAEPDPARDPVAGGWRRQRGAVAAAACVLVALAALVVGTEAATGPSTPLPAGSHPAPSVPAAMSPSPGTKTTPVALSTTSARSAPVVRRTSAAPAPAHGKSKHHRRKR